MAGTKHILKALADFFLPRKCVVCGRHLNVKEEHLCLYCRADLPFTHSWTMRENPFALSLNEKIEAARDVSEREMFAYAAVLIYYKGGSGYDNLTKQVKYHGNLALGRYLGAMLGSRLAQSPLFADVDLIVPVPLHFLRRLKRGYNQADAIAQGLCDRMNAASKGAPSRIGVTVDTKLLSRHRHTHTQTNKTSQERSRNVSGAFSVSERHLARHLSSARHILIVDDVYTTGATTFESYRVLRKAFGPSVRISVATIGGVR